jgi:hypothetical protein
MLLLQAPLSRSRLRARQNPGGWTWRFSVWGMCLVICGAVTSCRTPPPAPQLTQIDSGLAYTHQRVKWPRRSIHVVRLDRSTGAFELRSVHAQGTALGVSPVSELAESLHLDEGAPILAVNGDFYQLKGNPYAGDPRGLQIVDGELISAPNGKISFWIDADGQPHVATVTPHFEVTWPDGTTTRLGVNERRMTNMVVLYTPAVGPSTLTTSGYELILEPFNDGPWLPLRIGQTRLACVRRAKYFGSTRLGPDDLVLSIDPMQTNGLPDVKAGAVVELSLATTPNLRGARMALSGGPILVHEGRRQALPRPAVKGPMPREYQSMREQHPRTALGWNDRFFYLVVVDGRQRKLSHGMKLRELADYMIQLGCQEAINLDGGGSSTLWYNGAVLNRPSDGWEREVANALVVVWKPASQGGAKSAGPWPQ